MNEKKGLILIIFFLAVTAGFIYSLNLKNQLFWDDLDWIANNPFVHSFSAENIKNWLTKNTLAGIGLKSNYYRPFLFFTFAANFVSGGVNPLGYHLVNNLLHIANGILLFALLLRVLKKRFVAFFAALIFLVHPLQTEAVTYISGRGDPLNVFFMLSALWLFLKSELSSSQDDNWRNWRRWLSLGLLILALLSRETAIVFPFLAMVVYLSFLNRLNFWNGLKKAVIKTLPYFATVFIYGILRLTVLNFENILNFYSRSNIYTEHLSVRIYTFLGVLLEYFKLLFAPVGLHMERGVTVYGSLFFPKVFISLALVLLMLALLFWFYFRQKNRKTTSEISLFSVSLFAFGWFFVNLGPTSGITPINAVMYEHWLYLALVGPATLIIFLLDEARRRGGKIISAAILVFLLAATGAFSFLSVKRNIVWGDPIKFYENILKYEPDSVRINNNLGNTYYDRGDYKRAEEYYWKAVSTDDNFPQPHYNLGSILQSRNDFYGALVEFEKAIAIDPDFPYAYQNMATIYARQGKFEKSRDSLLKLVQLGYGHDPRLFLNLGKLELLLENREAATEYLKTGLELAGQDEEAKIEIQKLLEK